MIATLTNVSFRYPRSDAPALVDVNMAIARGEFVLLAGPSAGGKSTLLRLFNGLVPQFHGGVLSGRVDVGGFDPSRTPARRMAAVAGIVFQDPESQAIAETVEDDVAFTMEQHGVGQAEMIRRMGQLLDALGIEHLRHRRLSTLSGGERQRAAIAAVLALQPQVLLLDEPTSQLDPDGASAVLAAVQSLHKGGDLTVLLAEHRLERLLPAVDSVVEVEDGRVRTLTPREAARELRAVPAICELGRQLGWSPVPLTVVEAGAAAGSGRLAVRRRESAPSPGEPLLAATGLTVAYGEHVALKGVSLTLRAGEVVALMGSNGSGKSTLFRALTGLVRPSSGEVRHRESTAPTGIAQRTGFAGMVPQDPSVALYHDTVRDELAESLRLRGGHWNERVAASWGIEHLLGRNPRDVSVGQQQRVAIATMLGHEPRVWLLDEPTRGADAASKRWLAERLGQHSRNGGAAIVATHDRESAARFATRVVGLEAGRVAFDLPADVAFGSEGPLPTQAAELVPGAILPEDVRWA